jgi:inosine-uridine nucleoside N-ribohydrolase
LIHSQIPVFRGSDEAMVMRYDRSHHAFHGNDGFNDVAFDWEPDVARLQKESANSAIHRLARENPSEVTIVEVTVGT